MIIKRNRIFQMVATAAVFAAALAMTAGTASATPSLPAPAFSHGHFSLARVLSVSPADTSVGRYRNVFNSECMDGRL